MFCAAFLGEFPAKFPAKFPANFQQKIAAYFQRMPAKASSNCKPCAYRNRRVSEETSGITLPICHSQSVERQVKFVAEASAQVERFHQQRDESLDKKIISRKLAKTFDPKTQFK